MTIEIVIMNGHAITNLPHENEENQSYLNYHLKKEYIITSILQEIWKNNNIQHAQGKDH